jgi:alpha-galactosidase
LKQKRALANVPAVRNHPEYFIKEAHNYFLDYANPDANEYMTEVVCSLVEKYGIEFIKFDFNADCLYDNQNSSFYRYHTGHREFINKLRKRYPDMYIQNCASGGTRMDLGQSTYFDGVWFSDNQNLFDDIKIIRNTLLRLPPSVIERWAVLKSVDGFSTVYSSGKRTDRLLTVKGATWQDAETD